MKFIKDLGHALVSGRKQRVALFECLICHTQVVKRYHQGGSMKSCSAACKKPTRWYVEPDMAELFTRGLQ